MTEKHSNGAIVVIINKCRGSYWATYLGVDIGPYPDGDAAETDIRDMFPLAVIKRNDH